MSSQYVGTGHWTLDSTKDNAAPRVTRFCEAPAGVVVVGDNPTVFVAAVVNRVLRVRSEIF